MKPILFHIMTNKILTNSDQMLNMCDNIGES